MAPADATRLIEEAKIVKKYITDFDTEFNDSTKEYFWLVSCKWMKIWQAHVSYEEANANQNPNGQFFGKMALPQLNEDIVENVNRLIRYPDPEHYGNVVVRPTAIYGKHYQLIGEDGWNFLKNRYPGGIEIKRPCFTQVDGNRKTEVNLKKVPNFSFFLPISSTSSLSTTPSYETSTTTKSLT